MGWTTISYVKITHADSESPLESRFRGVLLGLFEKEHTQSPAEVCKRSVPGRTPRSVWNVWSPVSASAVQCSLMINVSELAERSPVFSKQQFPLPENTNPLIQFTLEETLSDYWDRSWYKRRGVKGLYESRRGLSGVRTCFW